MRGTVQTTMRTDTTGKMIPLTDTRLSPRSKGLVVGAVTACLQQEPLATFTRNILYTKISQMSTERKKYLNKLAADEKRPPTPLFETSDPPLSETSDPPVMHDLTIHLQDPDQVVAAFTAPARTGRTATTRPTSIPLPSVVSEHALRIDVGKSILDILPSEECDQERWRVAVAALHELDVEAEGGERHGTGTYEFVLDSHPTHHDHGYLLMSSEQLATLDVKLVPSLQLNQQWQRSVRDGETVQSAGGAPARKHQQRKKLGGDAGHQDVLASAESETPLQPTAIPLVLLVGPNLHLALALLKFSSLRGEAD
ncbi:hypothetical protein CYMTET_42994 [Cymbomonas tetramitiformis]|uniref:Uncharacterized protein n=1 Tax=Cymbomonas tetramitiformis TaxID=36881 RepID=A0AAE0F0Y5_9CHLO|nr:hypothetical protein CYMTET_42994 [Cymbomonas tetramitiformis]